MIGSAIVPGRTSSGFTLVEVLVAVAVLALGLLGGGATLLAAVRSSHQAQLRTLAGALAADLLDRVRANAGATADYALRTDEDAATPGATCDITAPCSPDAWARVDLYEWQQAVRAALPDARTEVTVESPEAGVVRCTVTLHWRVPGRDEPESLVLRTEA